MDSYSHGWQPCRACHLANNEVTHAADWQMRANPGYWGSSNPRVLILGFSKGANQIAAASSGAFDAVAFAGARPRLKQVLDALGIDLGGQSMDSALTITGSGLGAASLVRCGLSKMVNGKLKTSGSLMTGALKMPSIRGYMAKCIDTHLPNLPASVKTVVLLGTDSGYVKGVKVLLRAQFSDYQEVNNMAFNADGRKWVFGAHPSPANGTFKNWVEDDAGTTSGRKRWLAQQALSVSSVTPSQVATLMPEVTAIQAIRALSRPVAPEVPATPIEPNSRLATTFYLLTDDGQKLVPVQIKNTITGFIAFRASKLGNTKSDSREITDETELLRMCDSGQYLVRVINPLKKSSGALIRPGLKNRVVRA